MQKSSFLTQSRKTPAVVPDGFGYHVINGTKWGANIHVLHIVGLADGEQGIKECIECWGGPKKACGTNAKKNGTFTCCVSGGCPVTAGADAHTTEYKMSMTLKYTRNVSMVRPVDVETYLAPNCSYEYNALPSTTMDGETHLATSTWIVDRDKESLLRTRLLENSILVELRSRILH